MSMVCFLVIDHSLRPNSCPGEQHQRHRKIMNPAFSVPQLKSFVPLFLRHADRVPLPLHYRLWCDLLTSSYARLQLVQKWKQEETALPDGETAFINIHRWLSRTTLDVIGEGMHIDRIHCDEKSSPECLSGFWLPIWCIG